MNDSTGITFFTISYKMRQTSLSECPVIIERSFFPNPICLHRSRSSSLTIQDIFIFPTLFYQLCFRYYRRSISRIVLFEFLITTNSNGKNANIFDEENRIGIGDKKKLKNSLNILATWGVWTVHRLFQWSFQLLCGDFNSTAIFIVYALKIFICIIIFYT